MMRKAFPGLFFLLAACGSGEEGADEEAPEASAPQSVAAYPFEGLWANSFTDCSLEPGSVEEAPILITSKRMVGYENECAVTDVTVIDEAAGRYELARSCMGEGETYEEVASLRISGDTLMFQSSGGSVTWLRCPATEEDG